MINYSDNLTPMSDEILALEHRNAFVVPFRCAAPSCQTLIHEDDLAYRMFIRHTRDFIETSSVCSLDCAANWATFEEHGVDPVDEAARAAAEDAARAADEANDLPF